MTRQRSRMRVFNFAAGPAALPGPVLEQVRDELLDWQGCGASVMELSHRSKPFMEVARESEALLRNLLGVPDSYRVLFLQGGARAQFAAVPLNLAQPGASADYLNTGIWSQLAIAEGRRFLAHVHVAADEAASGYTTVPEPQALRLTSGAAYVHYTVNETIGGVEFPYVPDSGAVPLVADMSSTLLSPPRARCSTPRRRSPGTWPDWCCAGSGMRAALRRWRSAIAPRRSCSTRRSTRRASTATRCLPAVARG